MATNISLNFTSAYKMNRHHFITDSAFYGVWIGFCKNKHNFNCSHKFCLQFAIKITSFRSKPFIETRAANAIIQTNKLYLFNRITLRVKLICTNISSILAATWIEKKKNDRRVKICMATSSLAPSTAYHIPREEHKLK